VGSRAREPLALRILVRSPRHNPLDSSPGALTVAGRHGVLRMRAGEGAGACLDSGLIRSAVRVRNQTGRTR